MEKSDDRAKHFRKNFSDLNRPEFRLGLMQRESMKKSEEQKDEELKEFQEDSSSDSDAGQEKKPS